MEAAYHTHCLKEARNSITKTQSGQSMSKSIAFLSFHRRTIISPPNTNLGHLLFFQRWTLTTPAAMLKIGGYGLVALCVTYVVTLPARNLQPLKLLDDHDSRGGATINHNRCNRYIQTPMKTQRQQCNRI
jgi:hypothetical protein